MCVWKATFIIFSPFSAFFFSFLPYARKPIKTETNCVNRWSPPSEEGDEDHDSADSLAPRTSAFDELV